ncbi:L,D-transpeptidase family protein [Maricaulis sp.]|uniref:L,D-transpeptidase family protein n=1 Tax=Maricaulis sp. TaxID=1486257 RepID=UPI001B1B8342|nr:L,D-transpeptidase family protein [Maricaulis sp.]MBO6795780.1 L,D-transpeptidase family protein [Maricaulis sp.]
MDWKVSTDGWITGADIHVRAALGRSGVIAADDKREGDGATPTGRYPVRRVLYRPDRGEPPETALPCRALREDDGWCDAPQDAAYNCPVRLPFMASHEKMWREDELYDIVVVLGHNDDPPTPGAGSAIFLHCKRGDFQPTEGCVALANADVRSFLRLVRPGDHIVIG